MQLVVQAMHWLGFVLDLEYTMELAFSYEQVKMQRLLSGDRK